MVTAAGLAEMAIITGQVIRGKRSHFNVAMPFDAARDPVRGRTPGRGDGRVPRRRAGSRMEGFPFLTNPCCPLLRITVGDR